jgi:iron complex transport system ATP-binding protein
MDRIEKLKEEKEVTIVMVTHGVNLAAMYGECLLLLKEGHFPSFGRPKEVLNYQALEEAYSCTILIDESPIGKYPRITSVPQKHRIAAE